MRTYGCMFVFAGLAIVSSARADDAAAPQEGAGASTAHFQDLNLSDEQEAKIHQIRQECRQKIDADRQHLQSLIKEEADKIRGVLTPEQREKIRAFREDRREHRAESWAEAAARFDDLDLTDAEMAKIAEIRKEYRPKIMNAMKGFQGILTDEQRKARAEAIKEGKSRREMWAGLNLSDEQKQKAKAVCGEVRGIVKEEMDAIRGVLTPEQQEKLGDIREERQDRVRDRFAHAVENYRDLNLSDEQKNQIRQIRNEYRPKIHDAGDKFRADVRDELHQIADVVKGG